MNKNTIREKLFYLVKNSDLVPDMYWGDKIIWLYSNKSLGMDKKGHFYFIKKLNSNSFSYPNNNNMSKTYKLKNYMQYTWNSFFRSDLSKLNELQIENTTKDIFLFVKPNLKARDIVNCQNQAIKRALIQKYGFKKLLNELRGEIIHHDAKSSLIKININEDEPIVVVKVVDPSTKDIYLLRVPPDMKRCRQAIAWTFQLEEEEYVPLVET